MTLTKLHKKIYDVETGIETIIDLTPDEIKIIEAQQAQHSLYLTEQQKITAAKDADKQAVLDKLGLTADEVAALLG
jgi:hypothetical protein